MPIYEYVCQDCGVETEVMQRMSDPPATDCPSCGKAALTKVVSAAGFRLSGGGWYETDFKSGGKKNLSADPVAAKTDTKTESKAESKAETKSEAPAAAPASPAKPSSSPV
ncbi:zinc ribbon domain-containing protein [Solimonas sp. K1W22B-7]|uniref:FmdB family zinc ribbon protein n=1 Tax=Solimonas sp. K1W22B-7 TaxID=2303331 RepID=UPI000E3346E1|nr:zinc ribbon domain-containing protein [Solimonas sp. K1W22B-7]AXQ29046.1 zinc ribbon domain-containing protein [Solimonas sp. K1W22B-7]